MWSCSLICFRTETRYRSQSLQFRPCTWMRPFLYKILDAICTFLFFQKLSFMSHDTNNSGHTGTAVSQRMGWEGNWLTDWSSVFKAGTQSLRGEVRPGPGRTQDRCCTATGRVGWMLPQQSVVHHLWLCLVEVHAITWPNVAWSGFGALCSDVSRTSNLNLFVYLLGLGLCDVSDSRCTTTRFQSA